MKSQRTTDNSPAIHRRVIIQDEESPAGTKEIPPLEELTIDQHARRFEVANNLVRT
jgi:hypothetical protein